MQDERIAKAIDLFQEAWTLLGNLAEVRRRLPPADMPPTGRLPADWSEERSYAVCVHSLEAGLRHALSSIIMGLDFRNEFNIRDAILPASAKSGLTGQAWLDHLDRLTLSFLALLCYGAWLGCVRRVWLLSSPRRPLEHRG